MPKTIKQFFHSNKWSILLALSLTLFFLILMVFSLWRYWGIPHIEPLFLDTHAVLSASDAHRDGYNAFLENPYDVLNRVHIYSRIWLLIGHTNITRYHTPLLGSILAVVFLLLSIIILRPKNKLEFLLSVMILFSPAILLGVERGNNDLVVFILLAISGYCMTSRFHALQYISYGILFLSSMLKFYPLIAFLSLLRLIRSIQKFWITTIVISVCWGIYFWWTYDDFLLLQKIVIRPYVNNAFGAQLLFCWLQMQWPINKPPFYVTTAIIFLGCAILSNRLANREGTHDDITTIFFLIGSLPLLFCFFFITNFDYRCIFFIFTLPYWFHLLALKSTHRISRRCAYVFFIFLPMVVWNELILSAIPPLTEKLGTPDFKYDLKYSFIILEQISSWIVMTILLFFTMALLLPPLKEKFHLPFAKKNSLKC